MLSSQIWRSPLQKQTSPKEPIRSQTLIHTLAPWNPAPLLSEVSTQFMEIKPEGLDSHRYIFIPFGGGEAALSVTLFKFDESEAVLESPDPSLPILTSLFLHQAMIWGGEGAPR